MPIYDKGWPDRETRVYGTRWTDMSPSLTVQDCLPRQRHPRSLGEGAQDIFESPKELPDEAEFACTAS
jgi:hypothetical protein